jgi:hypothetical protein
VVNVGALLRFPESVRRRVGRGGVAVEPVKRLAQ